MKPVTLSNNNNLIGFIGVMSFRGKAPLILQIVIFTVGDKNFRALEIIRVKKFLSNAVLGKKYLSSHDL